MESVAIFGQRFGIILKLGGIANELFEGHLLHFKPSHEKLFLLLHVSGKWFGDHLGDVLTRCAKRYNVV